MQKTLDDVKCELDMALTWAMSAKNALQNCGGYSSNQLVFGRNVNMPTVLEDKLPALESNTSSHTIRKNLEALHSARKNFIQPIYLEIDRTKEIDSELSQDEVSELRLISGQRLWSTSQTRPDVAFEGCQVGNYGKHPTVRNILEANKAIQKLQ